MIIDTQAEHEELQRMVEAWAERMAEATSLWNEARQHHLEASKALSEFRRREGMA